MKPWREQRPLGVSWGALIFGLLAGLSVILFLDVHFQRGANPAMVASLGAGLIGHGLQQVIWKPKSS